jgi:ESCRT-I complex subunit TSG101
MNPQTTDWLISILVTYKHPDKTLNDTEQILISNPTLKPKTSYFSPQNLLLNLYGTLPIQYKQNIYNIPVTIWIPKEYPNQAPVVIVVPTENMMLQGKVVDSRGFILMDYLRGWRDGYNLNELAIILASEFQKDPPVVAKPQVNQNQTQNYNQSASHTNALPEPQRIQGYKGVVQPMQNSPPGSGYRSVRLY